MKIVNRRTAAVINTPHGSEIRPLMDRTTSSIENCSLAEEILPPGSAVGRHHHRITEEIYYIVAGNGRMDVGGGTARVGPREAIFISAARHRTLAHTGDRTNRSLVGCGSAHRIC